MPLNPFKLMKKYSKEYPWRFYTILCVVSASAFGEYRYRLQRKRELLLEQDTNPVNKNAYEEYLEQQKKLKENKLSEERKKFQDVIESTNKILQNNENKNEVKINNKEKINKYKSSVNTKKGNLKEKIVNNNFINKVKENTKVLSNTVKDKTKLKKKDSLLKSHKKSISTIETEKKNNSTINFNEDNNDNFNNNINYLNEIENLNTEENTITKNNNLGQEDSEVTINNKNSKKEFHDGNVKFKSFFKNIVNTYNSHRDNIYDEMEVDEIPNKSNTLVSEELEENPHPERMIFLYDIYSKNLKE